MKKSFRVYSLMMACLYGYMILAWIINLVQLLNCDFAAPYKEEAVHLIGLMPGLSMFTVWY